MKIRFLKDWRGNRTGDVHELFMEESVNVVGPRLIAEGIAELADKPPSVAEPEAVAPPKRRRGRPPKHERESKPNGGDHAGDDV